MNQNKEQDSTINLPIGGWHGQFLTWDGYRNQPQWVDLPLQMDHTGEINEIKDKLSNIEKDINDKLIVLVEGAVNRHLKEKEKA